MASPDGRRVFVANSGQDTITVIDVATRKLVGHVDLRKSLCNEPDKRAALPAARHGRHQEQQAAVRHALPLLHQAGRACRPTTTAARASSAASTSRPGRARSPTTSRSSSIKLAPQITGFTIDSTGDGVADPTSAFPNQLQSIVIRGNHAYLPNIAASPTGPAAVQRGHPGVRQRHRRRQQRRSTSDRARPSSSTSTSARAIPSRARRSSSSPTPGPSPSRGSRRGTTRRRPAATCWSRSTWTATGKLNFTGRRRHDPLHRPERPGQPGHGRRQRGQEPAGHRHQQAGHARLRHELRLAQRQRGGHSRPTRS